MPTPAPIHAEVTIAAPPAAVWAVVSDVTRMPEWSPELRRLYAVGGRTPRIGMRLIGLNRRGWAVWPTTSTVVRLEPHRAVAWKTRESGATWTYEMSETAEGTRLTGRRDLPAFSLGTTVLGPVIGGAEGHDVELAAGIRQTLERIKATVEAG
ncbi:MAG: SRPBCC family protein [Nocardioides sp.]